MNKLRHLVFTVLYLAILFNTSLNAIFPLYFLKSLGYECSGIINFLTYRVNSAVSLMILKILGIKMYVYKKRGTNQDPKKITGSIIVTPNHIGELDPLLVGCLFSNMFPSNRRLQVFSKESVRWYPAIGWFLLATDALFVRYGKKRTDNGQDYFVRQLRQDSHKEKTILIFPEGGILRPHYKAQREAERDKYNAPEYKNVVMPKTTGAYLIGSNLDVTTQVLMTIRLVTGGQQDKSVHDMGRFIRGEHPDEVHILMDSLPFSKDLVEDRDKFDQEFYRRFQQIDKALDQSLEDWNKEYERIELVSSWRELGWFVALTSSVVTPFFFYTNPYYLGFLGSGILFYYFKAWRALK